MKTGTLRVMNSLAVNHRRLGSQAASRKGFEQCVELAREVGSPAVIAGSLGNLADSARIDGDYGFAESCLKESLQLFEEVGDLESAAWTLSHQADLIRDQGRLDEAEAVYRHLQLRGSTLQNDAITASAVFDRGGMAAERGEHPAARTLYRDALAHYWRRDERYDMARVFDALAFTAEALSEHALAIVLSAAAANLRESLGHVLSLKSVPKVERCLSAARAALPGAEATECWLRGRNMTLEEAYRLAMGEPA